MGKHVRYLLWPHNRERVVSMSTNPVLQLAILVLFCNVHVKSLECSDSDREALIALKSGLNDPENRLVSWKGMDCCHWRGVRCNNGTGAVTMIDLHNPHPLGEQGFWNLSGEISPSLTKLRSLRYLDLSFNTFNNIPVPEFFGSLKKLQYLNLSNAGFGGLLPQSLGNISSLQYLDMENLGLVLDKIEWVAGLVSLKYLAMDNMDLSTVKPDWIKILSRLRFLTELHMSDCGLSGAISSPLTVNFTSLSVVDLTGNNINSQIPSWLMNVSSLTAISMSDCNLYGRIPLGLGDLPSLRSLDLSGNGNLSASCSQLFRRGWSRVEVLILADNKIHGKLPSSIGNVSSLAYFDLLGNNVEGGIPSTIGRLCNLNFFRLSGNNLNGTLPESLEGTENCNPARPLFSLEHLDLSNNKLVGELPEWLGQLENLNELSLGYNSLQGPIVDFRSLEKLSSLGLQANKLNGTLPESIGQLSELSLLDVSSNQFTGTVSEAHFSKLNKLKILHLSSNSLRLNVSSNWVPPFQVRNLDMGSCYLGPPFPVWLKSQNAVLFMDFSNASFSGPIPNWFWNISANLALLNVSYNRLEGRLPNPLKIAPFADVDFSSNLFEGPIPLPSFEIVSLELSNNIFSGSIPKNIGEAMPNVVFLSLANNQITGEIPDTVGEMQILQVINLSGNNLTGKIPSTIGNCSLLKAIDLANNNLVGPIPDSLGQLNQLQTLHLSENRLTGKLPPSFQNLSNLETLNLGNNGLVGSIPPWIGTSFPNLRILTLRSNAFSGAIPALTNLDSLQVLDLAQNKLNGSISIGFSSLKAMFQRQITNQYLLYGKYRSIYYEENYILNTKGNLLRYTKTLSLVISIDLSGNELYGVLPQDITELAGLIVLNLSQNHISGQIPANISNLIELSYLDLSNNRFSGPIPPSLTKLIWLSDLNLSNNNLTGKIPVGNQFQTFSASSFAGNPGLCGEPLSVMCQDTESIDGGRNEDEDNNEIIDQWFYLSLGVGFAAGILVPFCIFAAKRSWSNAYFQLLDKVVGKVSPS
ncbi:leucine-rich repeat receptor protein kinase MSL1-like [Cucurbita maxima]|uniref:Leucine-rich repeat receptor protein kinase MSL1-like n=1 Tax=Cucurbita maxima TaxID=3661 RepID=A0A6J1K7V9_CUCMA|nr:leucine-rich repeat receptor protein kinase MSL1-like [Cucurbita maxima]